MEVLWIENHPAFCPKLSFKRPLKCLKPYLYLTTYPGLGALSHLQSNVFPQRATRAAGAAPGSWRGGTSPSWTWTPCGGSTASTGHTALLSPCPGLTHPSLHRVDFEMFGYSPNSYLELARNSLWYTDICHKIVKISCYSKVEYSSQSKLLIYLM